MRLRGIFLKEKMENVYSHVLNILSNYNKSDKLVISDV